MRFDKIIYFLIVLYMTTTDANAQGTKIKLNIDGEAELTATLAYNSSTTALIELLKESPLTIAMSDYGNMEKVGPIGTTLPRNDEQITTEPGDIILYQGSALVIYYAPNAWNFTRIGKIDNISQDELKAVLGKGDITVTLELANITLNVENPSNDENLFVVNSNPVHGYLEVSGPIKSLILLDMNGKTIKQSNKNMLNLKNIKAGSYLLKIEAKSSIITTKKILIQ